jgi:abortive infection bacteriophage resistance protein
MLKKPTTYAEQLQILKKRNLDISDDYECIDYLERVNYYRFSVSYFNSNIVRILPFSAA